MKCVDCMYFTRQNGDNGYCSEFVQPVNVRCGCSIDAVKDAFKEPRPDLVEVVRCKDCRFWGENLTEEERKMCGMDADLVCSYWLSDGLTLNDYCSKAERRQK